MNLQIWKEFAEISFKILILMISFTFNMFLSSGNEFVSAEFSCSSQHYHFLNVIVSTFFYISFLLILANFEMPFPRDPKTLSMGVLARHQRLEAFAASREDVRCPRIRCRCSVSHGRTLDQISFTKKLGFLLLLLLVLHIIIVLMF